MSLVEPRALHAIKTSGSLRSCFKSILEYTGLVRAIPESLPVLFLRGCLDRLTMALCLLPHSKLRVFVRAAIYLRFFSKLGDSSKESMQALLRDMKGLREMSFDMLQNE